MHLPELRDLTIKSLGFKAAVVQLELQQNEVESRYLRLSVVWVLEFSFLKKVTTISIATVV